jgi:hypothetical protein
MTSLQHTKVLSGGIFCDSCGAQDSDKRYALYKYVFMPCHHNEKQSLDVMINLEKFTYVETTGKKLLSHPLKRNRRLNVDYGGIIPCRRVCLSPV